MAATTQPTDFSDLYTDIQNRVRVQTGVTATANQAKRYINIALHDMHIGMAESVPWAERGATIVTQPTYTTGSVTIARGSTSLEGTTSGEFWNTNNVFGVKNMRVGGKVVINGAPEVYEVSAVLSDTAATLSSAFVGTADVSGASYEYFEDEYSLASDFLRPIDQQSFSDNMDIAIIGRTEFRRRYPRNKVVGKPRVATIVDKTFSSDTSRQRRIVFWQPPDDAYSIRYHYVTSNLAVSSAGAAQAALSADADEPIVPLRYRHALVFHALYHWYRDKKDDNRAAEARAEYVDLMIRISNDNEIGSVRPKIQPNVSSYRRSATRPWQGQAGRRYTTGTSFDELRS